jgi:hypothetical protein
MFDNVKEVPVRHIIGCLAMFCIASSCGSKQDETLILPYGILWQKATRNCLPDYPESSMVAGRSGLAIAEVAFDARGETVRSIILQSPDEAISQSVQACVSTWAIESLALGKHQVRRGKLYFYFTLSNGSGKVLLANNPNHRKLLADSLQ